VVDDFVFVRVASMAVAPELRRVHLAGEPSTYGDDTVHRGIELVVATGQGEERIRLLGSMIEQGGRWKVFSYVVDD